MATGAARRPRTTTSGGPPQWWPQTWPRGPRRRRGVRTLDLFLGTFGAERPCGRTVVTLPKVTDVEQVRAFLPVLDALEAAHRIGLDLELQIETPQAVLGADGAATLARMV